MSSFVTPMRTEKGLRPGGLIRWLSQTSRETKEHAAAVATILVLTVVLFSPLLKGYSFSMVGAQMFAQYPWMGIIKDDPEIRGRGLPQADHAETFYPASVFATKAVRSGQFPMWLPYSFGGIPIMEVGIGLGLLYPPKLLAMLVLSPIHQHDFLLFTHLLLAGLGMYALLRCWGANAVGALLGAVAWEFSGHNAFWLIFEHIGIVAAWFPLTMLGSTLAVRKQSLGWAVATGAAMGMSVLQGYMLYVQLSAMALTCWYGALTITTLRRLGFNPAWRSALRCLSLPVISAAVAAALSAACWLSLLGLLSHVNRQVETLEHQVFFAVSLRSFLLGLIRPDSTRWVGSQAFVGIPTLIFVVPAFFRRSAPVIFATLMALLSLGILLGFQPLIEVLRLTMPYFAAVHLPVGIYLFCFAIATLAAFGVTEAGKYFSRGESQRRLFLRIGLPLIAVASIAVTSIQLIQFAWVINPTQPAKPEWLYPETPLISSLKANQGDFHILPIYLHDPTSTVPTPLVLAGKVAADFELRSGSGYESLLPQRTAMLWGTVERAGTPARPEDMPPVYRPYFSNDPLALTLLKNISVGLLAAPPNTKPGALDGDPIATGALQSIYNGPDGEVFKVTNALPRAFLTPRVLTAPDDATSLKMLADKGFDARQGAIVVGERMAARTHLPLKSSSSDSLEATAVIVRDRLNEIQIEVNTPRAAMLVLNDSWDAGWRARVDGGAQPAFRVNYAFRGVVVPEGRHRVTFLYRPTLLLIGLAISAGTLLLLLVLCARIGLRALRRFSLKATAAL